MKRYAALLILSSLLTACGEGSSGGSGHNTQPEPVYVPEQNELSGISFVDVGGRPLANASITITPFAPLALSAEEEMLVINVDTDANGFAAFPELQPGRYNISISLGGVTVSLVLDISDENANDSAVVAAPVEVNEEGTVINLQGDGYIASLNGVIYDAEGPVAGAQIEVSAGVLSNGAISTALTDESGAFFLVLNVGEDIKPALASASIRIVRDGYAPLILSAQDLSAMLALSGLNFRISRSADGAETVYTEDFSQQGTDATCGQWLATGDDNQWHEHSTGLNIINQAWLAELVLLAPDDTSAGYVPDPYADNACWYGRAAAGSVAQGNFMGIPAGAVEDEYPEGGLPQGGGLSELENMGVLESPLIDLTAETAPLALEFRTWWEIESVNPNNNGYDIMSVQYSLDAGENWIELTRLNPLSDPVGLEQRDALPYSNRGFNKAPAWLWQEPISLDALAGQMVKLRLVFSTNDELYNGFRGWLVDDLRIIRAQGTFPLWDDSVPEEPMPE